MSPFFLWTLLRNMFLNNIYEISGSKALMVTFWIMLKFTDTELRKLGERLVGNSLNMRKKERKNHKLRVSFWAQDSWQGKSLFIYPGDAGSLEWLESMSIIGVPRKIRIKIQVTIEFPHLFLPSKCCPLRKSLDCLGNLLIRTHIP